MLLSNKISKYITHAPFSTKLLSISALVAIIISARTIWKVSKFCYRYFIRTNFPPHLKKKYGGQWAVVAGATGSLGEVYAALLARYGYNIIIIGRSKELMKETSIFLNDVFSVETIQIQIDFNQASYAKDLECIYNSIKHLDIGIMVNTVGINIPSQFQHLQYEEITRMIDSNIMSHVFLTRLVLPIMKARTSKSAIINISSIASDGRMPYMSLYGGCKAFMNAFTSTLAVEYSSQIDFLCARPGAMLTKMNPKKVFYTVNPKEVALNHTTFLGYDTEVFGHWKHALQFFIHYRCYTEAQRRKRGLYFVNALKK